MSDTIKAWHEMQEEENNENKKNYSHYAAKYIWVLDFEVGEVFRYDISSLCNYNNNWNPDSESCEAFLIGAGHNPANIEWMVTTSKTFEYGN